MSSSDVVEIKWLVGPAVPYNREPMVKLVDMPARRQGKSWAMSRLSEAIRSGRIISAWGDMDTPDEVGLSGRESRVTGGAHINPAHEEARRQKALEVERERAKKAQEEAIKRAIAEEQRRKAEEERRRQEEEQTLLESIEGYGSF